MPRRVLACAHFSNIRHFTGNHMAHFVDMRGNGLPRRLRDLHFPRPWHKLCTASMGRYTIRKADYMKRLFAVSISVVILLGYLWPVWFGGFVLWTYRR